MSLKERKLNTITETNNRLKKELAQVRRKLSSAQNDLAISKEDVKTLESELSFAQDRVKDIVKLESNKSKSEINGLEEKLRISNKELYDLRHSIDDQLRIKTNELQIKIDLLNAELESKDSVSKQKHEIEIKKLEANLDIANSKVELYQQQYEGTTRFTNQMLTTIQIMGTAKANPKDAKALIELTHTTPEQKVTKVKKGK